MVKHMGSQLELRVSPHDTLIAPQGLGEAGANHFWLGSVRFSQNRVALILMISP